MKKLFLLLVSLACMITAEAQNRYINVSFMGNDMKQADFQDLKSNYGASFTTGRTYRLLGNHLRLGLDVSWLDLNYTNYKIKHITNESTDTYFYHQGEIAMQIGPSLTFIPTYGTRVSAYYRYSPAFSCLYDNVDVYGNYASLFVTGGSISFGAIGLGAEYRYGNCNYKNFTSSASSQKAVNLSGWKAYITFRF